MKNEYESTAFAVECQPKGKRFICKVEEIHGDKTVPVQIEAEEIDLDGCGGVDAIISPTKVSLKRTTVLSEENLREEFHRNPEYFTDVYAINVSLDRGKLYAFSRQAYPCE